MGYDPPLCECGLIPSTIDILLRNAKEHDLKELGRIAAPNDCGPTAVKWLEELLMFDSVTTEFEERIL